jgi:flagellar biosynthesis protein FliP
VMTTSFTRILIVLGFLRQALGTQNAPPGHVLSGLALFMTVFIMMPVWQRINAEAVQPFMARQIAEPEAWSRGIEPLRTFMARQTGHAEMALFVDLRHLDPATEPQAVPLDVLIPAFMLSELKTAFQMGFLIYLPFLVIDLVISSALMALGMFMLPPVMISLPAKVLFFVLADGWTLVMRGLASSFAT